MASHPGTVAAANVCQCKQQSAPLFEILERRGFQVVRGGSFYDGRRLRAATAGDGMYANVHNNRTALNKNLPWVRHLAGWWEKSA